MTDRSRVRLVVLRALVISLVATLLGRLWYVQVLDGKSFRKAAASNNVRIIYTPAPRGLIVDDQGRTLAGNADAEVVSVDRTELLRLPDGGAAMLHRLAGVLHLKYADLLNRVQPCNSHGRPLGCWNGSPYQPIPVSSRVSVATAFTIQEQPALFPGVQVQVQTVRTYPQYTAKSATRVYASHLLGYLGPISQSELAKLPPAEQAAHLNDLVGRAGLEETYNSALAGKPGLEQVSVDHLGNPTGVISATAPVAGDTLVTSIDSGLERDLEQSLASAVARLRASGSGSANAAAGVVMDAYTGRVVAMASYPTYAPNAFVGGISTRAYQALISSSDGSPLENRAIQGAYLPGSTFKLFTSSAVLAAGQASPNGLYDCPPSVSFFGHSFHNYRYESAGMITLHDAIAMSCDTVFYEFGEQQYLSDQSLIAHGKKPAEITAHMAMDYGLGRPSGVDLPGEASGILYDRSGVYNYWKTFLKPNACKGAKNPHFSAARRAADQNLCLYGGIFEPGDQLELNIGQGGSVAVTPLQMAVAYSALINGGKVWSPRVGEALVSPTGQVVKRINPVLRGHLPVPAADLAYVRDSMYGTTQETSPVTGTAVDTFTGWPFGKVDVGGKTGTASVTTGAPNGWFDSFAGPPNRPRYAAAIVVVHGGVGDTASAPVARAVWSGVYGIGAPPVFKNGLPPTTLPAFDQQGVAVAPAPMPPPASGKLLLGLAALPAERLRVGVP